jgi:hypothetical protein
VSVPGTGAQLLILLLFVIPGSVFQAARSRFRGPSPADQDATNRVLRAIAVSALLNAAYLFLLGPQLGRLFAHMTGGKGLAGYLASARQAGLVAMLLLFVVPVALAGLDYWRTRWNVDGTRASWRHFPQLRLAYDPTPRAWDFAFTNREPCFVRVLTDDGWIGGWYGPNSFAASYPEPLEIHLERAWVLDEDGAFVEAQANSGGLYVRCDDARAVEFLSPLAASVPTPRHG